MRSSGADATDIVVLVIALNDGVQPQTREAASVAMQSKRTIIVALNKVDLIPPADRAAARAKILNDLAAMDILPEEFGGTVQVVEISARTREGIDTLVESLIVQAEVMELTASSSGAAEGIVLGANTDRGLGVVVDAIVRQGQIAIGDVLLIGTTYGRVKNIYDDSGKSLAIASPAVPIRITGMRECPSAGQDIIGFESEGEARGIADRRQRIQELRKLNTMALSPNSDVVISTDKSLAVREDEQSSKNQKILNLMLKADSIGTLNALQHVIQSLMQRSRDVEVKIIDANVGSISGSDVDRVTNVKGKVMILGFNVNFANTATKNKIKEAEVVVARDNIIYRLEEAVIAEMEKTLPKECIVTRQGTAQVLKVFVIKDKVGTVVAGLRVKSGSIRLAASSETSAAKDDYRFRVYRRGTLICEDIKGVSLKKFKDSVEEVEAGMECGLTVENFKEFEEGDEVECYKVDWAFPKLQLAAVTSKVTTGTLASSKASS
jgi:translation initiation factor IF-2